MGVQPAYWPTDVNSNCGSLVEVAPQAYCVERADWLCWRQNSATNWTLALVVGRDAAMSVVWEVLLDVAASQGSDLDVLGINSSHYADTNTYQKSRTRRRPCQGPKVDNKSLHQIFFEPDVQDSRRYQVGKMLRHVASHNRLMTKRLSPGLYAPGCWNLADFVS